MNLLKIVLVAFLVIGSGLTAHAQMSAKERSRTDPIRVGDIAPDFSLVDQNGDMVRLSSLAEPVVLVFYRGYW